MTIAVDWNVKNQTNQLTIRDNLLKWITDINQSFLFFQVELVLYNTLSSSLTFLSEDDKTID